MFRIIVHYTGEFKASIVMASQAFATYEAADALLQELIEKDGFTGGHVEQKVEGIGWVLED